MKGRTTFVIAHRIATIRNANRILVFAGGASSKLAFDELMRLGGHFAELARSQFLAAEMAKPKGEPMPAIDQP
jgi:ATP-binding cassette subfamily B protein